MEGQWVCFVNGTRTSADQCPPDAKRYWMVNYVTYDSPEAYAQIQEQIQIQAAQAQAFFDQNPVAYPPCVADPPHAPGDSCGWESCDLHNILWLQIEGATLEQAIGLTAVYSFAESWGYGTVADTLGGMDEFNKLNEEDFNVQSMIQWYNDHQPLVHYIMETREHHSLDSYWWCAKHNDYATYQPKRYDHISVQLRRNESGQFELFDVPGFGPLHPGYDRWDEFLAAAGYTGSADWWSDHPMAHFKFEVK